MIINMQVEKNKAFDLFQNHDLIIVTELGKRQQIFFVGTRNLLPFSQTVESINLASQFAPNGIKPSRPLSYGACF